MHGASWNSTHQEEQCNLGTPKSPGEDRGVHNCPCAPIPKGLALGSTYRACKHFLSSFVFSHSTSEPSPGTPSKPFSSHGLKHETHPPAQCSAGRHWHCLLFVTLEGKERAEHRLGKHPCPPCLGSPHTSVWQPPGKRWEGGWQRDGTVPRSVPQTRGRRHGSGALVSHCWEVCHAGGCWQDMLGVLSHLLCVALF